MQTVRVVPQSRRGHSFGRWRLALLAALALALVSACTPNGGNSPPATAGVAISNMFPEAKSAALWLRHGWHVAVAYVLGFAAVMYVLGWQSVWLHP